MDEDDDEEVDFFEEKFYGKLVRAQEDLLLGKKDTPAIASARHMIVKLLIYDVPDWMKKKGMTAKKIASCVEWAFPKMHKKTLENVISMLFPEFLEKKRRKLYLLVPMGTTRNDIPDLITVYFRSLS